MNEKWLLTCNGQGPVEPPVRRGDAHAGHDGDWSFVSMSASGGYAFILWRCRLKDEP